MGSETTVEAGDAVFVDRVLTSDTPQIESLAIQERREAREARRERQTVVFQTVQVVATALSALAAIYVATTTR